jgi:hypothetical protein
MGIINTSCNLNLLSSLHKSHSDNQSLQHAGNGMQGGTGCAVLKPNTNLL